MPGLCDAHLHLQEPELDSVREEMSEIWTRLGLVRAVCNGTRETDWPGVAEAAERDDRVLPAYGLHPWYLSERSPDWLENLEHRVRGGKAVIGEVGIDHGVENRDDAVQEEIFIRQLDLGYTLDLPVTIHCVRAWGRLNDLLRANRHRIPGRGFLLHAYGGSAEMVRGFADLGARFSFSARAGTEGAANLRRALKAVPADRLLIETDAPALPPPPVWTEIDLVDAETGRRINHPANIAAGYRFVAEFLERPLERLAEQVERNFVQLFGPE